jgi:hypothetical protein
VVVDKRRRKRPTSDYLGNRVSSYIRRRNGWRG